MTFSVLSAIDRHVGALETERQPDGKWHPSSISGCARQAVYGFRGVPKSDERAAKSKRILRIGHILHQFAQDAVMAEVGVSIRAFYEEVKIDIPELNITGSVDGVLELYDGTWVVLEFKTISSNGFKYAKELPKPEHVTQVACYLHALREHGSPARGIPPLGDRLTKAVVAYVEKQELSIAEYTVEWSEQMRADLVSRAAELAWYEDGDELPDRLLPEKRGGKHWLCGYCEWNTRCWEGS